MGYKLKTNSGAKKRFKIRSSGKAKHKRAGLRHNAGSKSQKSKRSLRGLGELKLRDEKKIKELFPYAR
ncbi:MAG: 50S ribosomal protein L35 [Deltaproteobacteria bacterium]